MEPLSVFRKAAFFVHAIGTTMVFCVFSAGVVLLLMLSSHYREAIIFFVSFSVMFLVVVILKNVTHVERPKERLVNEVGGSFPSGHAAATAFLAIMMPFLASQIFGERYVLGITLLFLTLASIVSASRLLLRVHTMYQIAAGLMIGALVPMIVIIISIFF
ncbi:phosphatase PAP2 family protein [Patescibacteria group bacterium]|nr:MAG: phosphatase PAP2 family protein [Patescibacteria group bacterium]